MTNARVARARRAVPPSPDVQEHSLAQVIGQAVALNLAAVLEPMLTGLGRLIEEARVQPACLVCAARAKRAERDYKVALANAKAAAEPEPLVPDLGVRQSFTEGDRGWICWECYDPERDGPYTVIHELLGDPVD